ncbi:phage tail protein [Methanobrevibacter smithii]|jgi:hypothetical protein|uniref:phage tail protein n=1 Tax=Methanobrevibacter smithii TaxID=2173 RepID=UPI00206A9534|nr:MAG TPA: tail tube protein [Caudoviricetes sp.]
MGAKIKNPRKTFLFQIIFTKHPINAYLFQKATIPEVSVEEVEHGDVNRSVKTAGRVSVGTLTVSKLETTSGSDTWLWDWLMSVQDMLLGGGLTPSQYWETVQINELAEDGVSILNSWICEEVWPTRLNGQDLDRMSSDNTIEEIEFSVGTVEKL